MVEKNASAPMYWVLILIMSVIGIVAVFMSWMDVTIIGQEASYNASDFATSDVFKEGGLFEEFSPIGIYIPVAIGVLSLIQVFLAILGRTNPLAAAVVGLLIFVLAVYFYTIVDPTSNGSVIYDRQVGIAVWVAMAVGLVSMIAAIVQFSSIKKSN